jgi:hypothetical protein
MRLEMDPTCESHRTHVTEAVFIGFGKFRHGQPRAHEPRGLQSVLTGFREVSFLAECGVAFWSDWSHPPR